MSEPTQPTQTNTGPCNTKKGASQHVEDVGKLLRARKWSVVLNNYTEEELTHITQVKTCNARAKICKEVGESGTPHLQCYFEFPNAIQLNTLKDKILESNRAHCEPAYKCQLANLRYCTKGDVVRDDFPDNSYKGEDLPKEADLYPWQKQIIEIIKKPKDNNRKLIWIVDEQGNKGKSMFGKYLEFHNRNVCYSRISRSSDILTSVQEHYTTYYFDFPRTLGPTFCPFTALECVLDGVVDDCKLKKAPRKLRFAPPWVIVVSNFRPEYDKLSQDRWQMYFIDKHKKLDEGMC